MLVVEDQESLRSTAAEYFREDGHHVLEAADAYEAMTAMSKHPVDVLFSDIDMPGDVDGLRLARWAGWNWPNTSIVLTSGYCNLPQSALPDGAVFMRKPCSLFEVSRLIENA